VATLGIAAFADLLANKLRAKLPSLRPSASIDPQIAALVAHIEGSADGSVLTPVAIGLRIQKAGALPRAAARLLNS